MKLNTIHKLPVAYHRTRSYKSIVGASETKLRSSPERLQEKGNDAFYANGGIDDWGDDFGNFIIKVLIHNGTPDELDEPTRKHMEIPFDKVEPIGYGIQLNSSKYVWFDWNRRLTAKKAKQLALAAATPDVAWGLMDYFGYDPDMATHALNIIANHQTDADWMYSYGGVANAIIKQKDLALAS